MNFARSVIFPVVIGLCASLVFAQEAEVKVSLSPAGSFVGKTKDVKGTVQSDGATYSAKDIVVGLQSLETGITLRDKHTKDHLEVEKFPTAKLIKATGKDGKGTGTVEIRGIQKEVNGTYKVEGSTLVAEFPIQFSDFNIKGIRYAGLGVKDKGTITVRVPVTKGAAPSPAAPAASQAPAKKNK